MGAVRGPRLPLAGRHMAVRVRRSCIDWRYESTCREGDVMTDMPLALYPQGLYDVHPMHPPSPPPPPPPSYPWQSPPRCGCITSRIVACCAASERAASAPRALRPPARLTPHLCVQRSGCVGRAWALRAACGASHSSPPAAVGPGAIERNRTGKGDKMAGAE